MTHPDNVVLLALEGSPVPLQVSILVHPIHLALRQHEEPFRVGRRPHNLYTHLILQTAYEGRRSVQLSCTVQATISHAPCNACGIYTCCLADDRPYRLVHFWGQQDSIVHCTVTAA